MSGSTSVPEFNKKTMVDYMMLSNKVFEHCIDTSMADSKNVLSNFVKESINSSGKSVRMLIPDLIKELNNKKKLFNINKKNKKTIQALEETLFIIIQHCLGDKDASPNLQFIEYNQYQKNVIHNIIFNILKKKIINDFETFILVGIIKKIITRANNNNITLSHIDTLIYMLDKLFLYKFPDDKKKIIGTTREQRFNAINTKKNISNISEDLPDIYNRYIVYLFIEEASKNPKIIPFKFDNYFKLYNQAFLDNTQTFNNNLPTTKG
jgi:hypothetical protein